MTVTLPRPKCVNILWTILSGLYLAEYITKSISNFMRNVAEILFSYYRLENGGHIFLGLNVLTHCCWSQIAFILQTTSEYIISRICFTFAYAIVILKNQFETVVCKISAILSLPGCVNTLWQRQSDLHFEDNIFNVISNFRWYLNKI